MTSVLHPELFTVKWTDSQDGVHMKSEGKSPLIVEDDKPKGDGRRKLPTWMLFSEDKLKKVNTTSFALHSII